MIARLQESLLRYYVSNHRDLPWRRTRDPYRIWLSEVMLQQTRVATIVERYERFLSVFPDVGSLAAATVERVFEEWAGLGYYSRARNLHAAACRIVSSHGGQLPGTAAALATRPKQAGTAVLASTMVRFVTALVLVVPLVLSGWFDKTVLVLFVAVSYLMMLMVDTLLAVRMIRRAEELKG